MDRKKIINAYKERLLHGGVYKITNTQNGKYLIGHDANLTSIHNRFQFAQTTGSALHPKLKHDWQTFGASSFTLEILEELKQHPNQIQAEFLEELKTLEQLCRTNFDPSETY